jgi:hypothetical protein
MFSGSSSASVIVALISGEILSACATDSIESAGAPVVGGGDASLGGQAGSTNHRLDAAPPRDASSPTDPWANLPNPWDYFYPPGTIPPGPPPSHCLPPCLYETMVACGVPGAGSPLPDPTTCRHSITQYGRSVCDPVAGYLIVTDPNRTVYHEGEPCFRSFGRGCCSAQRPFLTWRDPSGNIIAEIEVYLGSGLPIRTYCGSADDPSSAVYDMNTLDPECAVWNYIRRLPTSATEEFTAQPHIYCPEGECPEPPPPPVGGDQ